MDGRLGLVPAVPRCLAVLSLRSTRQQKLLAVIKTGDDMSITFYTTDDNGLIAADRPVVSHWHVRLYEHNHSVFLAISDSQNEQNAIRLDVTSQLPEITLGGVLAMRRFGMPLTEVQSQVTARLVDPTPRTLDRPTSS